MANSKAKKMVVKKRRPGEIGGFSTDEIVLETNKTLLENNLMTFSSRVAEQMGYVEGEMHLTLVWEELRETVKFVRDSHKGGGWRSNRIDFARFAKAVGFRKHQGYRVYQVLGLGHYAFRFEKLRETFPNGGTSVLPRNVSGVSKIGSKNDNKRTGDAPGTEVEKAKMLQWRRKKVAKKSVSLGSQKLKKVHTVKGKEREKQDLAMQIGGKGIKRKLTKTEKKGVGEAVVKQAKGKTSNEYTKAGEDVQEESY